jgi:translation initiation factor 1
MSPDPVSGSRPRGNPFEALREKLGASLPRAIESHGSGTAKVTRPGTPVVVHERVTVRRERAGRGGKTVTVAEGPGLAGKKLEELATEAARALGVGARAEQGTLVLQGDQSERLAAWLAARGFGSVVRGN